MQLLIETIFWTLLFILFYAYLGYGIVLYLLIKVKRLFKPIVTEIKEEVFTPKVTLLIAAYNEEDYIGDKIENALELNYPSNLIDIVVVSDGSNDNTAKIAASYEQVIHLHKNERKGKLAAVDRVIPLLDSPIIIFSDANTFLNKEAVKNIVKHYKDPKVGVVSGEKRILQKEADQAAGAGEGIYWKYESILKKWDFELYSAVGAAGELFSIRKELHLTIPKDTIIEDFYLSMKIAEKGFKIAYEPNAYAIETASASSKEELKRKIRIAAGGIQAFVRLLSLLNIFKYGIFTFQYISHRILRWTIAPISLIVVIPLNLYLAQYSFSYVLLLYGQIVFYSASLVGLILESKEIKFKPFFVPYYFSMMNYAVIKGFFRYISGSQSSVWEKAKRAKLKD